MVCKLIRDLIVDRRGSVALYAALTLPVALLAVAGALDLGKVLSERSRLQAAIDKAALAGARELGLADARRENVPSVVAAIVEASMGATSSAGAAASLQTKVRDEPLEVEVVTRQRITPVLGSIGFSAVDVELVAVARIVGRPNICVLGLDASAMGTISLEKEARVTGQSCAVFSNSMHRNSIASKDSAQLTASLICAAGGKDGSHKGSFVPEPLVDCPTFDDPLAGRPEPATEPCDAHRPQQVTSSTTLYPG